MGALGTSGAIHRNVFLPIALLVIGYHAGAKSSPPLIKWQPRFCGGSSALLPGDRYMRGARIATGPQTLKVLVIAAWAQGPE